MKKNFRIIKKKILVFFFKLIYPIPKNIKYIKQNNGLDLKIKKIFLNKRNYKVILANKCRFYTDKIHDCAIIDEKNRLIDSLSTQFRINKVGNVYNSASKENIILKNGTTKFLKKFNGKIFIAFSGADAKKNYFHWFFDILPRFILLEKFSLIKNIDYFFVPSLNYEFQRETLKKYNLNLKKVLSIQNFNHLKGKQIILTSHPSLNNTWNQDTWYPSNWITSDFRKRFFDNKKRKPFRKIYVKRELSSFRVRKIINEKEIISFFF